MKKVLIYTSYVNGKYYFNPEFINLPSDVQKELKMICIKASESFKGAFSIGFYCNGDVFLESIDEEYFDFREIEAKLSVENVKKDNKELLLKLSEYYKSVCIKNLDYIR